VAGGGGRVRGPAGLNPGSAGGLEFALIEEALAELPEARLALDYHGLGTILVAGFLSEIQDPRRFVTGEKYDRRRKDWRPRVYRDGQAGVAKMAGLWWPRHSSGRFEGQARACYAFCTMKVTNR